MKQKQNVVVKRSMIALAGVFSLMGLLLFWGQDFIKAAGNEAPENGVFGIDNRVEYLHSLTFVMTWRNTVTGSIRGVDPKITGAGVLLVTWSVAVGSNTGDVKSFIWGGIGNKAWVDTTIGGGKNNTASAINSTILWGITNTVGAVGGIIGGGSGNQVGVSANAGSVVVGGENNKTFLPGLILGMKNNTNNWANNLIVGTNTMVSSTVSNVFVRSDSTTVSFSPKASNTFYINTQKGVWINTATPVVKFDSRGAVKFGTLPSLNSCNAGNVGLIGTVESNGISCVCACTSCGYWTSLVDDPDGRCTAICNPGNGQSAYAYNPASGMYSPEPAGNCKPEVVVETCHNQENGFPYCFDIIFIGNSITL